MSTVFLCLSALLFSLAITLTVDTTSNVTEENGIQRTVTSKKFSCWLLSYTLTKTYIKKL